MGVKGTRPDPLNTHLFEFGEAKEKKPRNTELHSNLCIAAEKWLRNHARNIKIPNCRLVCVEMVTHELETPDVMGWSSMGSIMIEVKVSRSDYLRDAEKWHRKNSDMGVGQYRYYCCPKGIIKETELPQGWGLLYVNENEKIEIMRLSDYHKTNLFVERSMLLSILRRHNIKSANP